MFKDLKAELLIKEEQTLLAEAEKEILDEDEMEDKILDCGNVNCGYDSLDEADEELDELYDESAGQNGFQNRAMNAYASNHPGVKNDPKFQKLLHASDTKDQNRSMEARKRSAEYSRAVNDRNNRANEGPNSWKHKVINQRAEDKANEDYDFIDEAPELDEFGTDCGVDFTVEDVDPENLYDYNDDFNSTDTDNYSSGDDFDPEDDIDESYFIDEDGSFFLSEDEDSDKKDSKKDSDDKDDDDDDDDSDDKDEDDDKDSKDNVDESYFIDEDGSFFLSEDDSEGFTDDDEFDDDDNSSSDDSDDIDESWMYNLN